MNNAANDLNLVDTVRRWTRRITFLWRPHGTFTKSTENSITELLYFYNIWRLEPSRYQTTYFIMGHSFKDIICCIRIVGNLGSSVNSSSLPSWVCNYLRNYIRSQKDEDQIITWRKRVFGEHDLGTYKRACLFAPLDFTSYQRLKATPTGTEPTPPNFLRDRG